MKFGAFGLYAMIALAFAASSMQGCGKGDLTRSSAAEEIKKSAEIARLALNVPIHDSAIEQGKAQGFWRMNKATGGISGVSDIVSSEVDDVSGVSIVLRGPAAISVEVTGITDIPVGTNGKEVKFAWRYAELPRLAKRLAVAGGTGVARFRRYDDGWRIESVQCHADRAPMTLSADEAKQRDDDVLVEAARRQAEEAARGRAADAREKRVDESRRPSRTILSYNFKLNFPDGATEQQIRLTDVGVEYRSHYGAKYDLTFDNVSGVFQGGERDTYISIRHDSVQNDLVPLENQSQRDEFFKALWRAREEWRNKYADILTK